MFNSQVRRPNLMIHLFARRVVLQQRLAERASSNKRFDDTFVAVSNRVKRYYKQISGAIAPNRAVTKTIDAEANASEVYRAACKFIDELIGRPSKASTILWQYCTMYLYLYILLLRKYCTDKNTIICKICTHARFSISQHLRMDGNDIDSIYSCIGIDSFRGFHAKMVPFTTAPAVGRIWDRERWKKAGEKPRPPRFKAA